ncbi:MAG: acyltransferase family protein [Alloprevotella sp.]|nr:acyltransferase family protein [Alloprevotella sp.]
MEQPIISDAATRQARDRAFSICKALAIVCVVISHSGAPSFLTHFVFQFHVPVFFLCAGYFFKEKYASNWADFVGKKFNRLYLPFLRWSLFFLIVHNLWFYTGFLNTTYGNAEGGVLAYYSWHIFSQRVWCIIFNMSGYDEFFAGSFWFFRALFIASLLFLLCYKLFERISKSLRLSESPIGIGLAIAVTFLLLGLWQSVEHLTMTGVAQGGFREVQAVLLMALGFVFSKYELAEQQVHRYVFKLNFPVAAVCLLYLLVSAWYYPTSMGFRANLLQWICLPVAGVAGFFMLLWLSRLIDNKGWGWLADSLAYIGDRTLYIFAFHLLAFRVVSVLKVWILGLPWKMVGCHTVVHVGEGTDLFFILYIIAGVGLPLLWLAGYRKLVDKYDLHINWAKVFNKTVGNQVIKIVVSVVSFICRWIWIIIRVGSQWLWSSIKSVLKSIKQIVAASNVREE